MRALILRSHDERIDATIEEITDDALVENDVLVRVEYSSLNYKDGLAVTGRGAIVRGSFPFVPGIDLAGEVIASKSPSFSRGDKVFQTGQGMGESYWGGYAERASLKAEGLLRVPAGLSTHDIMVAGTAGHTAALSVMALERQGVEPKSGEVVVTGASGGVGGFAVGLLSRLGYEVVALTSKESAHERLKKLGAARIESREILGDSRRPLESARWAGAVDATGGWMLSRLIAQTRLHGSIALSGNAAGIELETTVLPFILRGISLIGIDSNTTEPTRRRLAWERFAETADPELISLMHARDVSLEAVLKEAEAITNGQADGRVVVDLSS